MGKLISKGKHIVKVGNHPHKNMISKPIIMRGVEYKCRILEMYLKKRDQQLKTITHTHTHTHTHIHTYMHIYTYIHMKVGYVKNTW